MEDYQQFLLAIKEGKTVPLYYSSLIKYTPEILMDISMRNQNRVAKDLNLTSVKFSHLLPMLKELHTLTTIKDIIEEETLNEH